MDRVRALGEYAPGNAILAVVGWGGYCVLDDRIDLVSLAVAYMRAAQEASCGRCVPCSLGTRAALDILERVAAGRAAADDLATLERLVEVVGAGSMCELGHTAMTPIELMLARHHEAFLRAAAGAGAGVHPEPVYRTLLTAPCIHACPEHLYVPGYVEAVRAGRHADSLALIEERNPLPGVCGRVCVRFCELACRRAQLDGPVGIRALKRFVADMEAESALPRRRWAREVRGCAPRVAVVGGGPAGVTAAYHLLRRGYEVSIYEAGQQEGGMAANGIPPYRLPREVLRAEVEAIARLGARVHREAALGRDLTLRDLRERGYDAVFVAIGAQMGTRLRVAGEDDAPQGYWSALELLQRLNRGQRVPVGRVALVVGGGNVAIDCARSLVRLGADEVHVLYRRGREEMPADADEVRAAEEEGVRFHYLVTPERLLIEDGRLVGVVCLRMRLAEVDGSGRRRPVPVEGSAFTMAGDMLVAAVGQAVDTRALAGEEGLKITRWGTIWADTETLATSLEGVFAGGDCVTGPATLIEAMAAGMRAARSIDCYLSGHEPAPDDEERLMRVYEALQAVDADEVDRLGRGGARGEWPSRPAHERRADFDEVEGRPCPDDALREAERCLRCYRLVLVATSC